MLVDTTSSTWLQRSVASCSRHVGWGWGQGKLSSVEFDVAILDLSLNCAPSFEIAESLARKRVPFCDLVRPLRDSKVAAGALASEVVREESAGMGIGRGSNARQGAPDRV